MPLSSSQQIESAHSQIPESNWPTFRTSFRQLHPRSQPTRVCLDRPKLSLPTRKVGDLTFQVSLLPQLRRPGEVSLLLALPNSCVCLCRNELPPSRGVGPLGPPIPGLLIPIPGLPGSTPQLALKLNQTQLNYDWPWITQLASSFKPQTTFPF